MRNFITIDLNPSVKFNILYKVIQTEGFVVYEYNPFHNLRISKDRYLKDSKGRYYIKTSSGNNEELILKIVEYTKTWNSSTKTYDYIPTEYTTYVTDTSIDVLQYISNTNPSGLIPSNIETVDPSLIITDGNVFNSLRSYSPREIFAPISIASDPDSSISNSNKFIVEYYKNELVDFTTKDLNLDINHPVDIEIQESYDGSVNLVLTDDLNSPRIINSRFTPLEDKKYKIIDRSGNNDTNIYDENSFEGEINLYKTIDRIPTLNFNGVFSGGNLKIGNYVFYFKYVDSDGNETDFVAESGIVSILNGNINEPQSSTGALSDTNAFKLIRFTLQDIDKSYDYVSVYYTRSTGDSNKTEITKAYKIRSHFLVTNSISTIIITGLEDTIDISLDDINISYNIISSAKTQAQVQNRLFLGNINKVTIPYKELADLSLRIYPSVSTNQSIGYLDENYYDISSSNSENKYEYYNPNNIYYRVGYWEDIYRFGIVYILNDFTLSPVFNIRGIDLGKNLKPETFQLYEGDNRYYIESDEDGFIKSGVDKLDNTLGVVRIKKSLDNNIFQSDNIYPIGIKFEFQKEDSTKEGYVSVIEELKKYTKGFFFVRQKRIPTIYCQGFSIGQDLESHLPVIQTELNNNSLVYTTESFLNSDLEITNDFKGRLRTLTSAVPYAAIIPESELNSELYSQLFTGSKFTIRTASFKPSNRYFTKGRDRYYYLEKYSDSTSEGIIPNIILTYIDDNIQLKYSGSNSYSSRAGDSTTAYTVSYLEFENKTKTANNLLRGSWSSYVGIEGLDNIGILFEVLIPGYSETHMKDYFKTRSSNYSPYYSICDRTSWDILEDNSIVCYRGDCFIGNYTHRMCRNFQDPESPVNDIIVDPNTWIDNYSGYENGALDLEKATKINRGDVNAVQIGHWITFKCMSNINFASRIEDYSNSSEVALNGHPRTFYPISSLNYSGEYKIPESTLINVGLSSTTSDKYNFILPDVPYIKNDFSNRIMYSDIHITDAFKNSYRTFQISNYRDYNKEYGAIVTIVEWYGNLIVVFERGVGLVTINERVQTGSGEGGQVYLNSVNVLPERPKLLSKIYGSQWKDSIIKTDRYVYGVDTTARKIWRTNGEIFEIISDFKVQKFLNDNISLTERELTPLMGLRNVKSHFNKFKFDLMFTFYDDITDLSEAGEIIKSREWNLCYNEKLELWTTRYSWIPLVSENIGNVYFSYNKNSSKIISEVSSSWSDSYTSRGIVLKNCYTRNSPENIPNVENIESYISSVNYPGVEIPSNLNNPGNITKNYIIGELDIKLDLDPIKFKYIELTFTLEESNSDFYIQKINKRSFLIFKLSSTSYNKFIVNKEIAEIPIKVEIQRSPGVIGQKYNDTIYIRTANDFISTYFWRHGVAGIFDNKEKIYPTSWYKERDSKGVPLSYDPFEFEFVVNKNVGYHKIFTNLFIISNNVLPELVSFEVIGDAYDFSNIPDLKENTYLVQKGKIDESEADEYIKFIDNKDGNNKSTGKSAIVFYDDRLSEYSLRRIQPIKDMFTCGIIKGNTRYQEDFVNITLEPFKYQKGNKGNIKLKIEETRPRDKYIKIRVKYKGDKRVIITALQTMFEISFC